MTQHEQLLLVIALVGSALALRFVGDVMRETDQLRSQYGALVWQLDRLNELQALHQSNGTHVQPEAAGDAD